MDNRTKELLLVGLLRDLRLVEVDRLRRSGGDPERIDRLEREAEAIQRMQDRFRAGEDLPLQDDEDPDITITALRL